jgi:type II secretory pathway component GspD/PulD (secretin)
VDTGVTLGINPRFTGGSWRLNVEAKVLEFLGYDDPGTNKISGPSGVSGQRPLPHFRTRIIEGDATAATGDTLVLRGPLVDNVSWASDKVPVLGDVPLIGGLFRHKEKLVQTRRLYVFVTPEDAPGN